MTDDQLLREFVDHRDGSAFESLVRRHGPMVFRVCRDVLGSPEPAEDAFQATFLVLLRRAAAIRDRPSVGRWLYEVASRISRRERRRLAKIRSQERQAPEMEAAAPPDPDFNPADRELKPVLHEEIGRLPFRLREAIVLCYFEGLTVEAASRRLGCPVGTLKSRLGKARETLRSRLIRRGLAASALLWLMTSMAEESSAAVPESLLEATEEAGRARLTDVGVSRRIASMVLEEESRSRKARTIASWSVLAALILLFGSSRLALARKPEGGGPSASAAVRPAWLPTGVRSWVASIWSPGPSGHCPTHGSDPGP